MDLAGLKSHIPMMKEGCRYCSPGWTYINSVCYFFAFSDVMIRKPWHDARQFCISQGGDLAIVDTRDKQMAISDLINSFDDTSRTIAHRGFWIGLRDTEVEGIWKWLDGRRMFEGYWNDGEPNNVGNEDCAAVYPRANPFKAWNDAPCTFELKWICEMAPKTDSTDMGL